VRRRRWGREGGAADAEEAGGRSGKEREEQRPAQGEREERWPAREERGRGQRLAAGCLT